MVYFNSTAIRGAQYDERTKLLQLQFTSGSKVYDYPGVPDWIYRGLLAAVSKGMFYNQHIRDKFSPR